MPPVICACIIFTYYIIFNIFQERRNPEEMKMALPPPRLNLSPSSSLGEPRSLPSMSDILTSSKARNLDLKIQTLGPFFRVTGKNADTGSEVGRAEGVVRPWFGRGLVLHLDTIRLTKETMVMDKSLLGVGLYVGAVAIRHGYDCGCRTAQLLAIYDSDLYHSKVYISLSLFWFCHLPNLTESFEIY